MLEKIMQDLFLDCFSDLNQENNVDGRATSSLVRLNDERRKQMRHVLKSYALLGKQRLAEQLFTNYVVKPFTDQVKTNTDNFTKDKNTFFSFC